MYNYKRPTSITGRNDCMFSYRVRFKIRKNYFCKRITFVLQYIAKVYKEWTVDAYFMQILFLKL